MKRILPYILFAALLLAACGGALRSQAPAATEVYAYDYSAPALGGAPMEQPAAPMATAMYNDEAAANSVAPGAGVDASAIERMVIQNADLAIVVSDVEARMKEISAMAREMGGRVVSSNLYQSYASNNAKVPEGQLVIGIPQESIEIALDRIKQDVVEVQNETRSGEDITAKYVDLKSRLKNLEAAEAQLDEIMQQATETEDVINVFNQLVYYREQIELVKGQMKYYEEFVALSTISIRIFAEATIQPLEIAGWEPKGVARDAIQDLIYFYQDFVDFVIRFVIYTLPVWITVGIPLYLIFIGVRAIIRKVRGNKPKEQSLQVSEDEKMKRK